MSKKKLHMLIFDNNLIDRETYRRETQSLHLIKSIAGLMG